MSKYFVFFFLILGLLGVTAQVAAQQATVQTAVDKQLDFNEKVNRMLSFSVPFISVGELDRNQNDYIILDSREKEEYKVGHIRGAKCIGYDDFDIKELAGIDKDAKIAVYCSIGYRSEKITEKLRKAGYVNAVNVYGSIFQWVNDGKPIYNEDGDQVQELHTYNRKWSKWVTTEKVKKTW